MRGAWSALQVQLVPILILYWCGIHCAAMTADSIFMPDDEPDWVAAASAAGLQEEAGCSFPASCYLCLWR